MRGPSGIAKEISSSMKSLTNIPSRLFPLHCPTRASKNHFDTHAYQNTVILNTRLHETSQKT